MTRDEQLEYIGYLSALDRVESVLDQHDGLMRMRRTHGAVPMDMFRRNIVEAIRADVKALRRDETARYARQTAA